MPKIYNKNECIMCEFEKHFQMIIPDELILNKLQTAFICDEHCENFGVAELIDLKTMLADSIISLNNMTIH